MSPTNVSNQLLVLFLVKDYGPCQMAERLQCGFAEVTGSIQHVTGSQLGGHRDYLGIYLVCKTRGKAGNELSTSLKQQNTKNRGQTREEQGFALHAMRADLFSTQLHGRCLSARRSHCTQVLFSQGSSRVKTKSM